MKLTRFASGSVQGFGKFKSTQSIVAIGKYFWASSSSNNLDKWWNLTSWWSNEAHTNQATTLPTNDTDVIVVDGSVVPYVDLDRQDWVQPKSINARTTGITFYSTLSNTIACELFATSPGVITFTNNSSFNY